MAVPIYIARVLYLGLQRDCLTKSSNTRAFSQLCVGVLFITTITLAVKNDDGLTV